MLFSIAVACVSVIIELSSTQRAWPAAVHCDLCGVVTPKNKLKLERGRASLTVKKMLARSIAAAALVATVAVPCYGLHAPSSGMLPKAPISLQDSRSLGSILKPNSQINAQAMNLRGGASAAKPWYSAFWNESVELGVLFGLWYWGNVYCE